MQRVKHVLLAVIAAWVTGQQSLLVSDLDVERVGADDQPPRGLVGRHRVAVGLEDDLAVGRERSGGGDTTHVGLRW